jgi:uncharacterized peroxidase-related enzyme
MSRLPLLDAAADTPAKPLLDAVAKKLGRTPNMTRAMANSPAVLRAYLEFSGALAAASLSARTRELIALAVGEANGCHYCLAAHTAIGGSLGLPAEALLQARSGDSADPKTAAVLHLARTLVSKQGRTSDTDLRDARNAGLTDGEIAETVAVVALNVFTNWFNHVAETPVDFPPAPPLPTSCCTPREAGAANGAAQGGCGCN